MNPLGPGGHPARHFRASGGLIFVRRRVVPSSCRTLTADTDLAAEYVREVLERSDTPEGLLLGLRRIAEAQGMSRVAEAAWLSRESLYRPLSAAGNPRPSTLVAVLRVAGLKLSVRPAA